MNIRVAIVEDAAGFRDEIRSVLAEAPGMVCAGAWGSSEEALRDLPQDPADVVLVDLRLPGVSGVEFIRRLRTTAPGIQCVVLTAFGDDELVFQAIVAGARGYLLKTAPLDRLLEQIREAHFGGSPLSPTVARKVIEAFRTTQDVDEAPNLSPREWEVLDLLARGRRYKEIADACGLSRETIRTHVQRIYRKLQVNSRAAAIARLNGWRHTAPWLIGVPPRPKS